MFTPSAMDEKQECVIYRRERDGWVGFALVKEWNDVQYWNNDRTELTRVDTLRKAMQLCMLANSKGENE